jgi:predicted O-methyltransferase YrrM
MAKAIEDNAIITSLELNTDRIAAGKSFFAELNMQHKLKLIYADALKYLDDTTNVYDFIFLDAIKRSYMDYIPKIERVLKKGGVLVADNILFQGRVIQKDVNHKYYTGTSIVKEFNKAMAKSTKFKTIFIPVGDGISLSIKIV